jgi:hypothetical protein
MVEGSGCWLKAGAPGWAPTMMPMERIQDGPSESCDFSLDLVFVTP